MHAADVSAPVNSPMGILDPLHAVGSFTHAQWLANSPAGQQHRPAGAPVSLHYPNRERSTALQVS